MRIKLNKDTFISISIGVFLGIIIWALSPVITGTPEPWDAEGKYYPIALFISGAIGHILYPKGLFATVIGIYIGQVLYLFIFFSGPLWVIGVFLIGVYSLSAFIGSGVAWYLRQM